MSDQTDKILIDELKARHQRGEMLSNDQLMTIAVDRLVGELTPQELAIARAANITPERLAIRKAEIAEQRKNRR